MRAYKNLNKPQVKADVYIVRDIYECTYCHDCGCPLDEGDKVHMSRETEKPYCSKVCLNTSESN